jgi:hypothetical protein
MNDASLQNNSSWIFLDRDFEKERSIPFDSDQLTITPAGVFSDEAKPAARVVKSDEAKPAAGVFSDEAKPAARVVKSDKAGLTAPAFEVESPAPVLEVESPAPVLEVESPAPAVQAELPTPAVQAELPALDESMDKRKRDYKRLKTAHEMGLKPLNWFYHGK